MPRLTHRVRLGGLAVGLALTWAAPAAGTSQPVDLELVLAVDVSGSVDFQEARLQRQGYVAAITDPKVLEAIRSGILGRIAVSYFEWAGDGQQRGVVDWTLIEDEASARGFAVKLFNAPLVIGRFTSISNAILVARVLFAESGFDGTRQVIDISGDGPNNVGEVVTEARDAAVAEGLIINGLPIINDRPNIFGYPNLPNLDLYYQHCVIGGPGAFIVVAKDFKAFAAAIRRKMILEIADLAPPRRAAPPVPWTLAAATTARVPSCDIGERQLFQFLRERSAGPF